MDTSEPALVSPDDNDEATLSQATAPEDENPLDHVGDLLTDEELAAEGLEP